MLLQAVSGAATSMTQQMGGSPLPSPRPASSGPRQPLKPLVHSRAVLQETMREVLLSPSTYGPNVGRWRLQHGNLRDIHVSRCIWVGSISAACF